MYSIFGKIMVCAFLASLYLWVLGNYILFPECVGDCILDAREAERANLSREQSLFVVMNYED